MKVKNIYLVESITERVKDHFKNNWKTWAKVGAALYAHNRYVGWSDQGKKDAKVHRANDISSLKRFGKAAFKEAKILTKDTKKAGLDAAREFKKPLVDNPKQVTT